MKILVLLIQNTGALTPVETHLIESGQELVSTDSTMQVVSIDADNTTLASAVRDVINEIRPDIVLATNSALARAVVPSAAIHNQYTVISGISSITQGETLIAERIWNKGSLHGEVVLAPKTIVLMQPGFSENKPDVTPTVIAGSEPMLTVMSESGAVAAPLMLKEADTVVSIGRGVLKSDLDSVASIQMQLGAARGATRQAIEEGNATGTQKIGETGHSVSPELYLALGISGANQHMSGFVDAHRVIAINNYAKAPIASQCDHLIVADLGEFLPLLDLELRRLSGGLL